MTVMTHLTEEPPTHASRSWWAIGIVVTVLVLAAGLFFGYRWLAGSGTPSTETTSATYPQPITALDLRVQSGTVTLTAGADGQTTVQSTLTWDNDKPTVSQQWTGTTLSVIASCPGSGRCEADLTIAVPAGTTITTKTETGDASLTGLTGAVSASTNTGEIRLTQLGGAVIARTEVGSITGTDLASTDADVSTETGDVTLGFSVDPQTASATVATGDVTVTVPRSSTAYHVTATTDTGDRRVAVTQDETSTRTILARTDTGDVTVEAR